MTDDHGRDQVLEGELALDKDGRILGVRVKAMHNVGAYISGGGAIPLLFSLMLLPGVYDVGAFDAQTSAVFTNTAPTSPYRGAGRPEAIYAIERMIEQGARDLGIDRAEMRRRNFVKPEQMPHAQPGGFTYDSGEFAAALDQCLKLADYQGFAARRAESEKRGKRRGLGISYYVDNCNIFNERMELRVDFGRQRHDLRRHLLSRPGPRDGVRPARVRLARRAVRDDQLHPGRYQRGRRSAAAPMPRAAPPSAARRSRPPPT